MSRDIAPIAVFPAGAMGRILTAVVGVLTILWALPCLAENWPGFRGPAGQGISNGRIFIRSQSSLFCIRKRNGTSLSSSPSPPLYR